MNLFLAILKKMLSLFKPVRMPLMVEHEVGPEAAEIPALLKKKVQPEPSPIKKVYERATLFDPHFVRAGTTVLITGKPRKTDRVPNTATFVKNVWRSHQHMVCLKSSSGQVFHRPADDVLNFA